LPAAAKGEVWQVDLGIAGKVRPCLLLTDYPVDDELAMVTVLPHTTALRGNRWELAIAKAFLKAGAFCFPCAANPVGQRPYLLGRLGTMRDAEWSQVRAVLAQRR
jgi:mRNA interferase MazF